MKRRKRRRREIMALIMAFAVVTSTMRSSVLASDDMFYSSAEDETWQYEYDPEWDEFMSEDEMGDAASEGDEVWQVSASNVSQAEESAAMEPELEPEIVRTGNWANDLAAAARSQLGYTERRTDDQTKGATRYGDWYGSPYADWNTIFVQYCMEKAGIAGIPVSYQCADWIGELQRGQWNLYRAAGGYLPKAGDLVFINRNESAGADIVGIVTGYLAEDSEYQTPRIVVIAGDIEDQVQQLIYSVADGNLTGYAEIPVNLEYLMREETLQENTDDRNPIPEPEASEQGEGEIASEKARVEAESEEKAEAGAGDEAEGKEPEAAAEVKSEDEAEAEEAEGEAEVKEKAEAEVEAETEEKVEGEAETEEKSEVEAETGEKVEGEAETEEKSEVEAETEEKMEGEAETEEKSEVEAETEEKPEGEAEVKEKAEDEAEADEKAKGEAEAKEKTEDGSEAEENAEPEGETEEDTEVDPSAEERQNPNQNAEENTEQQSEPDVVLTGNWAADVVAVARSQIGYIEQLTEDTAEKAEDTEFEAETPAEDIQPEIPEEQMENRPEDPEEWMGIQSEEPEEQIENQPGDPKEKMEIRAEEPEEWMESRSEDLTENTEPSVPAKRTGRYGEWYGNATAAWNTIFVQYCLSHAGVKGVPFAESCSDWIRMLQNEQTSLYRNAGEYIPYAGDIAFIRTGQTPDGEIAGIVAEYIPAQPEAESPAQIKVIAGDIEDEVQVLTCRLDDNEIIGYAELPMNPDEVMLAESQPGIENFVNFTVNQQWEEGVEPVPVEIQLVKDGISLTDEVVTLNEENQWQYTWKHLPDDGEYSVIVTDLAKKYTDTEGERIVGETNIQELWVPADTLQENGTYLITTGDQTEQTAVFAADEQNTYRTADNTLSIIFPTEEDDSSPYERYIADETVTNTDMQWQYSEGRLLSTAQIDRRNANAVMQNGTDRLAQLNHTDHLDTAVSYDAENHLLGSQTDVYLYRKTTCTVTEQNLTLTGAGEPKIVLTATAEDGTIVTMTAAADAFPYDAEELTLRVAAHEAQLETPETAGEENPDKVTEQTDVQETANAQTAEDAFRAEEPQIDLPGYEETPQELAEQIKTIVDSTLEIQGDAEKDSELQAAEISLYDLTVYHGEEALVPGEDTSAAVIFQNDEKVDTEETTYQLYTVNRNDTASTDDLVVEPMIGEEEENEVDLEETVFAWVGVARKAPVNPAQFNWRQISRENLVDNRAKDIRINLYDYGGYQTNLEETDNTISNYYNYNNYYNYRYYDGINRFAQPNSEWNNNSGNIGLLFLASGAISNGDNRHTINHYTGDPPNISAYQGIVRNKLKESGGKKYPVLANTGRSLDYLFMDSNFQYANNVRTVYTDTNYLLQEDEYGYYYYNSDKNYARLNYGNTNGNEFTLWQDTYKNSEDHTQCADEAIGFFPFNDPNPSKTYVTPYHGNDSRANYYNHHFGMTLETEFMMMPNGTYKGQPMKFEFSGDDDVWVFVDDVLVLDIGGIHQKVSGDIDFSGTPHAYVSAVSNAGTPGVNGTNKTLASIFAAAGETYDATPYKTHTLKFYYLERGGCYSNCSIRFNLPTFTERDVTIGKKLNEASNPPEYLKEVEYQFQFLLEDGFDNLQRGYVPEYKVYTGSTEEKQKPYILSVNGEKRDVAFLADGSFKIKPGERIVFPALNDLKRYRIREMNVNSMLFSQIIIADQNGTRVQKDPIIVTRDENNILYSMDSEIMNAVKISDHYDIIAENVYHLAEYNLPSSGGIGTYWYTMFGTAVMACVLLLKKKRRKGDIY